MKENKFGYTAIITVLAIGAILVVIGTGVVLNSLNEVQSSFSENKKETSLGLLESCVEDCLIKLNKNNSLPATVVLPEGSCTVTTDSHVGNAWAFSVSGSFVGTTKTIQVSATRAGGVTVNSWLEQ